MSDERDPARQPEPAQPDPTPPVEGQDPDASVWDPWSPPPAESVEHTQPVWFDQTQELVPPAPADPAGPADSAGPADPAPPPAPEPTGWPSQPTHGGAVPAAGADAAYRPMPPGAGWDPITSTHADGGYAGQPAPWAGHHPPPTAPQQKGPGWGALVAVAAVASLLAAVVGGLFGGWLGSTGRVDFGRIDRSPSSIPKAGAGATARPSDSIAAIAARALPSVVTIKVKGADGSGTGSGFVLDRDGHVITNNHVVAGAGKAGSIRIELSNGDELDGTVVGTDGSYDLAVLKIGRTDLPPLTMGSSKDVVVGDQVIALGAPLGLESSVTAGIVSALNRPVSPGGSGDEQSFINAIQTDAAINPGNSGGPLLDMQGHVVGINSAIARVPGTTDPQSGNIGVGFSIPSDQVVKTAEQLIKTGKAQHPIIGVILDRQYTGDGVKVLASRTTGSGAPVSPGGPADKAGIKPGDVIVEFDGRRVTDADDLVVAIRAKSVGDVVSMKVRRGSETISVRLTLSGTSGS
jgi:putative serine protease PepD